MNHFARTSALPAMLDAATDFGLSREEAWLTLNRALREAGRHGDGDYFDEVAGALARRILAKQRQRIRESLGRGS